MTVYCINEAPPLGPLLFLVTDFMSVRSLFDIILLR